MSFPVLITVGALTAGWVLFSRERGKLVTGGGPAAPGVGSAGELAGAAATPGDYVAGENPTGGAQPGGAAPLESDGLGIKPAHNLSAGVDPSTNPPPSTPTPDASDARAVMAAAAGKVSVASMSSRDQSRVLAEYGPAMGLVY